MQNGSQGYELSDEERAGPAAFAASPSPPLSVFRELQAAMPLAGCHKKGILPSQATVLKVVPFLCLHLASGDGKPVRNGSGLRPLCQAVFREMAGDLQKQSGTNQGLASSF